MSKILEMRQKRAEIWDKAKAFLDEHQNENGVMSAEDTAEYERMEQDVVDMGRAIERLERAEQMDREMNDPANPVLSGHPERQPVADTRRGTASDAYRKAFWNSIRGRMNYDVRNALQVGELTEGGYTVPDEFENQLIEALQEENIMRGLVHVISTSSGDRKIPLVTNYGTASWIEEEAQMTDVVQRHFHNDRSMEGMNMITCKLGEKNYHIDFISGRALRELEPAAKMYAKIVTISNAAVKGEDIPETDSLTIPEAMDVMTKWFCLVFGNQFTPDELLDNYPVDRLMHDIALTLMAVQSQTTSILSEFPTKAAPEQPMTRTETMPETTP